MKKKKPTKHGHESVKKLGSLLSSISTKWLHYSAILLICSLVGIGGVKLTQASFGDSNPVRGSVKVATYSYGKSGAPVPEPNVSFNLSWVSGGRYCNSRLDHSSGSDGKVEYTDCVIGANGADITYHISGIEKAGFKPGKVTVATSGRSADCPPGLNNCFTVRANKPVGKKPAFGPATIYVYLNKSTSTPASTPKPPGGSSPTKPAPTAAKDGTLDVVTYQGSVKSGNEIGGVEVVVGPGGSGVGCTASKGTTDAGAGANHGHLHFTCPAGASGTTRKFTFVSATRSGYLLSSSPHAAGSSFVIAPGATTKLSLVLNRTAGATPAPKATTKKPATTKAPTKKSAAAPKKSSTPSASTPKAGSGSTSKSASNQKNGTTQLTTYYRHPDGKRTRVGGVTVHIQAVGQKTDDKNHNCTDYNQQTNSKTGQATFKSCWTGGGSQAYQLSYVSMPSGYSFRSFRITGPSGATFSTGKSVSVGNIQGDKFAVKANQTTKLEIWLNKNSDSGKSLSGIQQVVTQKGKRFEAKDPKKQHEADVLNNLAKTGNKLGSPDGDSGDGDDSGGDVDTLATPSSPQNVKAVQDSSGSIVTVTWDALPKPPEGTITYAVYCLTIDGEECESGIITDESYTGTSEVDDEVEPGRTYMYGVTATVIAPDDSEKSDSDESDPASTATITTKPRVKNVHADPAETESEGGTTETSEPATSTTGGSDADSGGAEESESDWTTVDSEDGDANLEIPDGATDEDLSCTVSDDVGRGSRALAYIGNVKGKVYTPICRDENGDDGGEFDQEVSESVSYDEDEASDDADLYGFDGTDWEKLSDEDDAEHGNVDYSSVTKTKKGNKTVYTVKTKRPMALALVSKHGKALNPAPMVSLLLLVAVAFGARIIIRRRLDARYAYEAYPYGDVDLMPMEHHTDNTPAPQPPVASVSPDPEPLPPQAPVDPPSQHPPSTIIQPQLPQQSESPTPSVDDEQTLHIEHSDSPKGDKK